jgi:hypothetical protein
VLDQQGKHLPTQLGRVPMPSVSKSLLAVVLRELEQAMYGRTVHQDRAVHSRFSGRCSLLYLPDDLTPGCLALLWGNGCLHGEAFFSFFVTLMGFFSVYHHLSLLSRCAAFCFTITTRSCIYSCSHLTVIYSCSHLTVSIPRRIPSGKASEAMPRPVGARLWSLGKVQL